MAAQIANLSANDLFSLSVGALESIFACNDTRIQLKARFQELWDKYKATSDFSALYM